MTPSIPVLVRLTLMSGLRRSGISSRPDVVTEGPCRACTGGAGGDIARTSNASSSSRRSWEGDWILRGGGPGGFRAFAACAVFLLFASAPFGAPARRDAYAETSIPLVLNEFVAEAMLSGARSICLGAAATGGGGGGGDEVGGLGIARVAVPPSTAP